MKHVTLLLLIASGLWLGFVALNARSPSYTPPSHEAPRILSGRVPAGHVVRSFEVEGMCCPSCAGKLHGHLLAAEGVEEAAVDFASGRAAAVAAESVPIERLLAALNVEKYTARHTP